MKYWPYWVGCFLGQILYTVIYRWKIIGKSNVPLKGPLIIAANHNSHLDPPLVGTAFSAVTCPKRHPWFMAKRELFANKVFGWIITRCYSFPVTRGKPDRPALKRALALLSQGEALVVFPEGTRSPDGRLQKPEMGIGLLAYKSQAPILPVAIIGSRKALPAGAKFLKSSHIEIRMGKPITFPDLYQLPLNRTIVEEIANRVMAEIGLLLGQSSR